MDAATNIRPPQAGIAVLCLWAALLFFLIGCGSSASSTATTGSASPAGPGPAVAAVTITPGTTDLGNGGYFALTATATYVDASQANVTAQAVWSAGAGGDSGSAIITSPGVVLATGVGTVTVTAFIGGVTGIATLTVLPINGWVIQSDMPTGRYGLGAAALGQYIYAVGGATCLTCNTLALERYDTFNFSWTPLAPMHHDRRFPVVAAANGLIYVLGGFSDSTGVSDANEAYNPADNTWVDKAPLPAGAEGWGGEVNGLIYVITAGAPGTVYIYDPVGDSWTTGTGTTLPPFPATAVMNGVLYWIGGEGNAGMVDTVFAYDAAGDSWSPKAAMGVARGAPAAAAIRGKIYVAGGLQDATTPLDTAQVYDPVADAWDGSPVAKTNVARQAAAGVAVNGKFYVVGGNAGDLFLPTLQAYTP